MLANEIVFILVALGILSDDVTHYGYGLENQWNISILSNKCALDPISGQLYVSIFLQWAISSKHEWIAFQPTIFRKTFCYHKTKLLNVCVVFFILRRTIKYSSFAICVYSLKFGYKPVHRSNSFISLSARNDKSRVSLHTSMCSARQWNLEKWIQKFISIHSFICSCMHALL